MNEAANFGAQTPRRARLTRLAALALAALCVLAGTTVSHAQGWSWPWEEKKNPPTPREPVYRAPAPSQAPSPAQQPAPGAAANWSQSRSPICLQLEQRLVQESQRGSQSRDQLPKLEAEVRAADRAMHQAQAAIDRADCYEYFLFSKTLRRTRACVDLSTQVENAKRKLSELETQRQQLTSSAGRSYQDDIIRELARNNCGAGYSQEARKREGSGPFSSVWQDEESPASGGGSQYGALPFATYRTVCVRLCDGYYFPISFSTLPNHFERDAEACQSKCAAPVELYYYQNPGGSMDQALAMKSQEAYTKLKSAFRYRKELVQGCSCKEAEYVAPQIQTPAGFGDRRAEAPPAPAAPQTPRLPR